MPMNIRPSEMSWSVAYALASTVGSREAGFVTQCPNRSVLVFATASARSGHRLLPEDVRVVRPAPVEAVLLGELEQLDKAAVQADRGGR